MEIIKRVNSISWAMLAFAFTLGVRHIVPEPDSLLGHPNKGIATIAVIVAALCFGFFGIEKQNNKRAS